MNTRLLAAGHNVLCQSVSRADLYLQDVDDILSEIMSVISGEIICRMLQR